ncbi:MAG: glycine-rich domain-containing protein [Gammaproteobacteria bacterium]
MPTNPANLRLRGIHPKVAALDFERLKWKLAHSSEAAMSPDMCDLAEREYRRFLTLKMKHPKISLVPSKLTDSFWHAHILDTEAYARDCHALFGRFMHHFPYFGIYGDDDQQALNTAFHETNSLYENLFGEKPPKFNGGDSLRAANCSDEDPKCTGDGCCISQDDISPNKKELASAARCGGHSCHVPSSCACRVPGACK